MGIIIQSAFNVIFGALGTVVTLYLTYLFNKYTKRTEAYRKAREEREAAALKKKKKMMLCLF